MVRTVLSLCLALGLGGSVLLAQETKQEKSTTAKAKKGPSGEVGRYSTKSKTISLAAASALIPYKISDEAKVFDSKGEESKDGLKDKRLQIGAHVQLVLDGSKQVKEIHLQSEATTTTPRRRRPAQAGKSSEETKSKDDKGKSDQKKGDDKSGDKK